MLRVPWTARRSNQSILKEIKSWSSNPLATWCEELTHWKSPDAGKDWGQEEKGVRENEMVGWHHWLNGPKFEQTLRDSEGQGSLVCCSAGGFQKVRPDWDTEQQTALYGVYPQGSDGWGVGAPGMTRGQTCQPHSTREGKAMTNWFQKQRTAQIETSA